MVAAFAPPTIDEVLTATAMISLLFERTFSRDLLSSLWEGRRRGSASFCFRVLKFFFGAPPEPGACPDAGADGLAVADADEAAETESVDAMMQPDADKGRRV
jgi:hypothetical protein